MSGEASAPAPVESGRPTKFGTYEKIQYDNGTENNTGIYGINKTGGREFITNEDILAAHGYDESDAPKPEDATPDSTATKGLFKAARNRRAAKKLAKSTQAEMNTVAAELEEFDGAYSDIASHKMFTTDADGNEVEVDPADVAKQNEAADRFTALNEARNAAREASKRGPKIDTDAEIQAKQDKEAKQAQELADRIAKQDAADIEASERAEFEATMKAEKQARKQNKQKIAELKSAIYQDEYSRKTGDPGELSDEEVTRLKTELQALTGVEPKVKGEKLRNRFSAWRKRRKDAKYRSQLPADLAGYSKEDGQWGITVKESNRVKKDGTKSKQLYGIDADGNKTRLDQKDILEAYGYGKEHTPTKANIKRMDEEAAKGKKSKNSVALGAVVSAQSRLTTRNNGADKQPMSRKKKAALGAAGAVLAGAAYIYKGKTTGDWNPMGGFDRVREATKGSRPSGSVAGGPPSGNELGLPPRINPANLNSSGTGGAGVELGAPKPKNVNPANPLINSGSNPGGSGAGVAAEGLIPDAPKVLQLDGATSTTVGNKVTFAITEKWADGHDGTFDWALKIGVKPDKVQSFLTEVMGSDYSEKSRHIPVGGTVSTTLETIQKYSA